MKHKWSIGLMTGTVNDGFIDVAALKTDGHKIIDTKKIGQYYRLTIRKGE